MRFLGEDLPLAQHTRKHIDVRAGAGLVEGCRRLRNLPGVSAEAPPLWLSLLHHRLTWRAWEFGLRRFKKKGENDSPFSPFFFAFVPPMMRFFGALAALACLRAALAAFSATLASASAAFAASAAAALVANSFSRSDLAAAALAALAAASSAAC